jgi:hypothetical protein
VRHVMGYRPGVAAPAAGFQGEGVLGPAPGTAGPRGPGRPRSRPACRRSGPGWSTPHWW